MAFGLGYTPVRFYLWGREAMTGMGTAGTGQPRELYHFFLKLGSEYSNMGYSPLSVTRTA